MTIYKTLTQEKKEKDETEVVMEPLNGEKDDVAAAPKVVRVTYGPRKSRTYVNLCLLIAALIVLGAGVLGAIFLYRHLSHRVFRGKCGVTYYDEIYHQQTGLLRGHEPITLDLTRDEYDIGFKFDFLQENIEVSEIDGYERLQVPKFDECEQTVIWHDFQQNYTAIVDPLHASCYVMVLNRTLIAPPRDVIDLVNKLWKGNYYFPRADVIRQKYSVAMPPMSDLSNLGPYIMRECFWYDTFMLEKIVGRVGIRERRDIHHKEEIHVGFNTMKGSVYKMTLIKETSDGGHVK